MQTKTVFGEVTRQTLPTTACPGHAVFGRVCSSSLRTTNIHTKTQSQHFYAVGMGTYPAMKFRRVQANKGMQPKRAKGQHWATKTVNDHIVSLHASIIICDTHESPCAIVSWNQTHMWKGVEANNRHPHLKEKHVCPIEAQKAPGESNLVYFTLQLFAMNYINTRSGSNLLSYLPIVLSDHLMQCIDHTNASPYTIVSLKSNPHAERSTSQQPTSSFERETLLPYRSEESTWWEVAAHARALEMKVLGCFARSVYFTPITPQLFDMDWT